MDSYLEGAMSHSIAQARQNLPALVHEVERTGACQLTRRGRPVAVLLSLAEYKRLQRSSQSSLWDVVSKTRGRLREGMKDEELADLRDRSSPSDFHWPD